MRFKKWIYFFISILVFMGILWGLDKLYPLPDLSSEYSVVVLDRNQQPLRVYTDSNGIYRLPMASSAVNKDYLSTLIAYEDRFFYSHFGINPLAILRALYQRIRFGKIISGGSTLTMQVARLIDPHSKTIFGKIKQMFRALQLEWHLSKDEILTLYLNRAPMGGNIEGVEAASWHYFSKTAKELNYVESALLAAIPQRPSEFRPDRFPEKAKKARDKVLKRLLDYQLITEKEYHSLIKNPLQLRQSEKPKIAPHLADHLLNQFPKRLTLQTTIDLGIQTTIEQYIQRHANRLPERASLSVLIVNNHDHSIRSWIGSSNFMDSKRFGAIDMVLAIRSPGSTLKPFIYGLALDAGIIHEASLLTDTPRNFSGYEPKNFNHQFSQAVTMREALQKSLNVPVVQVFYHLKPVVFVKALSKTPMHLKNFTPNLSLALGGSGTDLYSLVLLYSSLANQGEVYPLSTMLDQNIVEPSTRLLSKEANYIIFKTLSAVRPKGYLYSREIAWKTGTSYGHRDAWSIGVSPDWTVGVWVGRPDGVPIVGQLGLEKASPVMFDLFNLLPKDSHSVKRPEGLVNKTICWPSGRNQLDVPAQLCDQSFDILTINGLTPPTLYDGLNETNHGGWPQSLNKNEMVSYNVRIHHFKEGAIVYRHQQKIPLRATGKAPWRWYINGQLLEAPVLDLASYPEGALKISVMDGNDKTHAVTLFLKNFTPFMPP